MLKEKKHKRMGLAEVRKEFTEKHVEFINDSWFNKKGDYIHPAGISAHVVSRERLWHCISLLEQEETSLHKLADAIIQKTGIDDNHFEPFAAVEILLVHGEKLSKKSVKWLKDIVNAHIVSALDVRFGGPKRTNFTTMATFFFVACHEVFDFYEWPTHLAGSMTECGYSKGRLREIALNALYALAYCAGKNDVMYDWNSSTYAAFTLQALAKIVEYSSNQEMRDIALELEAKVWAEILDRHHPNLEVQCGPHSRSYRADVVQMNTEMDFIYTYIGLSKYRSILDRIYFETGTEIPSVRPRNHDDPQIWSNIAWYTATKFHVPESALRNHEHRNFPYKAKAKIKWRPNGYYIDPKNIKNDTKTAYNMSGFIATQGNLYPGGEATVNHFQSENWALGYRDNFNAPDQCCPIHFHYAVKKPVKGMRDRRSITSGVMFHAAPQEWAKDYLGNKTERHFNNEGVFKATKKTGNKIWFSGHFIPQDFFVESDELSLNSFYPLHFGKPDKVLLNDVPFKGESMEITAKESVCIFEDSGFEYEIRYQFPTLKKIRLYRWCNFIRFSAFFYQGHKRKFSERQLISKSFSGSFNVKKFW